MMRIEIDDNELRTLLKTISNALDTETALRLMRNAAGEAGIALEEVAKNEYPPERRPLPQAHTWTDAQRRFWWWVMHNLALDDGVRLPSKVRQQFIGYSASYNANGEIDIQGYYFRTNTLARSIASKMFSDQNKVRTLIGTAVDYARYVIGERDTEQSWYHRDNWIPLDELITQNLQLAADTFADRLYADFRREIGAR
ncbi:MAG: hypothetical protein D6712_20850 [Chloroflexi bacterium]|nr:MAG: hypothetical protein D6712_20850 [Chloroflexota bacterium]